jgi:hypothetical protein
MTTFQRGIMVGSALLAIAILTGFSGAAAAHHSFAGYERDKTVTIKGTIQEIAWTGSHVTLTLMTKDAGPYKVVWLSKTRLHRSGTNNGILNVGDPVSVSGSPHRDPDVHIITLITEVYRLSDGWRWWRKIPGNGKVEVVQP